MLRKSRGGRGIVVIATEMAIKEPHFEGSIQSNALQTKVSVHETSETIVRQETPPQGDDPFTLIREKWFLYMLVFHGHAFLNHLLHFKMQK